MACLTIGVLLAAALPQFRQLQQRQHLQGIAQMLYTDLQAARSQAVLGAGAVHLRISQHLQGSCYVLHTGKAGDCACSDQGQAICAQAEQLIKLQWLPPSRGFNSLQANVAQMSFQPRQGSVTSTGSIDIVGADRKSIRHIVSIAGRVRSCAPAAPVGGLPPC
ncbi:GspH/FimT family protein [Roseateles sp.]|uniref:GspH/FimT family protein n=1 Tax=Roseateles sp. TaxID=1971397 RepID=UPI00391C54DF